MASYYVNANAQDNGDHEVHRQGCSRMPSGQNAIYLGEFTNCRDAVARAKLTYFKSNGCYYCSNECHTG